MSSPIKLDDFLTAQSVQRSGFTATVEAIPDKPTDVRITPFREEHGCGCASSFMLPKSMIRSVAPTGTFHHCCGKRLEVVVVEFTETASVPVADLMKRTEHAESARRPDMPPRSGGGGGRSSRNARMIGPGGGGIVGRFPIPGLPCHVTCIEVCTEFCNPTGWDCCRWETRCGISCDDFA